MIKINLLPQELAGHKATPGSGGGGGGGGAGLLVAVILLLIFGANGALGFYLMTTHMNTKQELDATQKKTADIKAKLKATEVEYNEQKSSIDRMNRLISVAESLDPPDRLIWCEKLNMLPLLMPDGIHLTEVEVTQDVKEQETEESIKARNDWAASKDKNKPRQAPGAVKVPVITQTLRFTGLAYVPDGTPTERLQQITSFYQNLTTKTVVVPFDKTPRSFTTGFADRPAPSAVIGSRVDGREVSNFTFTMRTRSQMIK